jgi:hypothetical protein
VAKNMPVTAATPAAPSRVAVIMAVNDWERFMAGAIQKGTDRDPRPAAS